MSSTQEAIAQAISLMMHFAERTGLSSGRPRRRYLWTDAFAVCNLLELGRVTGERRHTGLALELVEQVHHVLGRHRDDDPRSGWLSGLGEREGELHPTRGGLRIGKPLPERGPAEGVDEALEWERDGQHFHDLTKWMHALDQVSGATGDPKFNRWARELAAAAHAAFVRAPAQEPEARRMVWKMSVDLSRPLVPVMGQHDPLDGFVTCVQLVSSARLLSAADEGPELGRAIAEFAALTGVTEVRTADPLGLGGLLADAWRVAQLMARGELENEVLLLELLEAAQDGLLLHARPEAWRRPASERLAFRELGLAIGLSALRMIQKGLAAETRRSFTSAELHARTKLLAPQAALGPTVLNFWLDPAHQSAETWTAHRDINEVMLATCLVPGGYLLMRPTGAHDITSSQSKGVGLRELPGRA